MILKAMLPFVEAGSSTIKLKAGKNLFAISGRGDSVVVLKATTDKRDEEIVELGKLRLQILASGFGIYQGFKVSEEAVKAIIALEGEVISDDGESYAINSVIVGNWPTSFSTDAGEVFSSNLEVNYKTL